MPEVEKVLDPRNLQYFPEIFLDFAGNFTEIFEV